MATLGEIAAITGGSTSAHALSRATARSTNIVTVEVQGLNAVMEHWAAIAVLTPRATRMVLSVAGTLLAHTAAEIHYPHWYSGDTWRSINAGVEGDPQSRRAIVRKQGSEYHVDVGPTTWYAPLLEFGWVHQTAGWLQFPFMMPAADAVEPIYVDAMVQVASIADQLRAGKGEIAGQALPEILHQFRRFLYSYSKFAGDVTAFTGLRLPFRGGGLGLARGVGDLEASMRGAIGTRIIHRAEGRFASRRLRASTSATISGPSSQYVSSANRLYNRVAGRAIGTGFGRYG